MEQGHQAGGDQGPVGPSGKSEVECRKGRLKLYFADGFGLRVLVLAFGIHDALEESLPAHVGLALPNELQDVFDHLPFLGDRVIGNCLALGFVQAGEDQGAAPADVTARVLRLGFQELGLRLAVFEEMLEGLDESEVLGERLEVGGAGRDRHQQGTAISVPAIWALDSCINSGICAVLLMFRLPIWL